MKCFRGVPRQNRHCFLRDDWARVNALVNKMHRDTRDLHPIIQGLLPRLQPWKCRQQRGMNIDHPAGKNPQKSRLQNSHKPRQHHQIHRRLLQRQHKRSFSRFIQLGAKLAWRNIARLQFARPCPFQNPGVFDITQHHGNLAGNFAGGAGIRNGRGIRAFARTEDAKPEFPPSIHALFLLQIPSNRKHFPRIPAHVPLAGVTRPALCCHPESVRIVIFDKLKLAALIVLFGAAAAFAHNGNIVTINSDNVLVLNGQKVFPVGFTLGPPPGAKSPSGKDGLQELADAGGTFIRTGAYGANWSEAVIARENQWEDAAARAGLHCWVYLRELGELSKHDKKKEALLREVISTFKDRLGLLAWKGADEPEWAGMKVTPLVRSRQIVRSLDTNHPIVIIQAPRGTVKSLQPYNTAGDIIGADVYPVGYPPGTDSLLTNKEISMVGDYTRTMMQVSQGKRPVWMVLQIAWSGVLNEGKTLRFPTFPEERFMTYEAIIDGARGLVYFGGNLKEAMSPEDATLGWNWTFWDRVLRPVVEEVGVHSPLEPALVAPESKLPITVSNAPGLEYCVRQAGPDLYILACKREGATSDVEFENLPFSSGEGEVMYESPRKVEVAHGKFSDWFGPFEVHIYHFKRP